MVSVEEEFKDIKECRGKDGEECAPLSVGFISSSGTILSDIAPVYEKRACKGTYFKSNRLDF